MPYLARKIILAKWYQVDEEISADAITSCLRTQNNELSFWHVENLSIEHLNRVVLALATAEKVESIQKIYLVCIDSDFFRDKGLKVESTTVPTKIEGLSDFHRDVVELNLTKLKILSDEIFSHVEKYNSLENEEMEDYFRIRLFTRLNVLNILKDAILSKILDITSLDPKVQKELEKNLPSN